MCGDCGRAGAGHTLGTLGGFHKAACENPLPIARSAVQNPSSTTYKTHNGSGSNSSHGLSRIRCRRCDWSDEETIRPCTSRLQGNSCNRPYDGLRSPLAGLRVFGYPRSRAPLRGPCLDSCGLVGLDPRLPPPPPATTRAAPVQRWGGYCCTAFPARLPECSGWTLDLSILASRCAGRDDRPVENHFDQVLCREEAQIFGVVPAAHDHAIEIQSRRAGNLWLWYRQFLALLCGSRAMAGDQASVGRRPAGSRETGERHDLVLPAVHQPRDPALGWRPHGKIKPHRRAEQPVVEPEARDCSAVDRDHRGFGAVKCDLHDTGRIAVDHPQPAICRSGQTSAAPLALRTLPYVPARCAPRLVMKLRNAPLSSATQSRQSIVEPSAAPLTDSSSSGPRLDSSEPNTIHQLIAARSKCASMASVQNSFWY